MAHWPWNYGSLPRNRYAEPRFCSLSTLVELCCIHFPCHFLQDLDHPLLRLQTDLASKALLPIVRCRRIQQCDPYDCAQGRYPVAIYISSHFVRQLRARSESRSPWTPEIFLPWNVMGLLRGKKSRAISIRQKYGYLSGCCQHNGRQGILLIELTRHLGWSRGERRSQRTFFQPLEDQVDWKCVKWNQTKARGYLGLSRR